MSVQPIYEFINIPAVRAYILTQNSGKRYEVMSGEELYDHFYGNFEGVVPEGLLDFIIYTPGAVEYNYDTIDFFYTSVEFDTAWYLYESTGRFVDDVFTEDELVISDELHPCIFLIGVGHSVLSTEWEPEILPVANGGGIYGGGNGWLDLWGGGGSGGGGSNGLPWHKCFCTRV